LAAFLFSGAEGRRVVHRAIHFIRRPLWAAGILVGLAACAGCSTWDAERWNIDRLRDPRAAEIEDNLAREKPIVADPF
jgi:hypothetical protein